MLSVRAFPLREPGKRGNVGRERGKETERKTETEDYNEQLYNLLFNQNQILSEAKPLSSTI